MTDYMAPLLPFIAMIDDSDLACLLNDFMRNSVPAYYWTTGASASGKYHPAFAKGEGGLVRHTVAVIKLALELYGVECMNDGSEGFTKDDVITAAMIHDTFKYGMENTITANGKLQFKHHGEIAASAFRLAGLMADYVVNPAILRAVECHMGQWTPTEGNRNPGESQLARIIHVADYIASRNFIDLPEFHEGE